MNWVFEHLQLLIVVGGAIAYWLNQRNKAKEAGGEGDDEETQEHRMPPLTAENADAMEQAERTRRIQEEIRRKILERIGGGAPQPPVEAPPVQAPVLPRETEPQPVASRVERREAAGPKEDAYAQPTAEQTEAADQAVLDRQTRLAEKLRELEAQRREHAGRAETFAENTATAMASSDKAKKGSLLADLRDPVAARRAIVMREVLGAPVGLR